MIPWPKEPNFCPIKKDVIDNCIHLLGVVCCSWGIPSRGPSQECLLSLHVNHFTEINLLVHPQFFLFLPFIIFLFLLFGIHLIHFPLDNVIKKIITGRHVEGVPFSFSGLFLMNWTKHHLCTNKILYKEKRVHCPWCPSPPINFCLSLLTVNFKDQTSKQFHLLTYRLTWYLT